ncbi:MAG: septal ring lytic transglycosylase RlpA family protein [Longimicrobiales bacterium]|nr:septal ring lytic transglycosylase RlpA family protein [Longimicrobiales bacterium]
MSTSACSLVGYPSGRGGAETTPAPVPASSATRPTSAPGGAATDPWSVPPGVRPPDPGHVYEVFGETYIVLSDATGYDERGEASWYGAEFDGRPTATGEVFNMHGLSAAHRTLPLHTVVEVTNLNTGEQVIVRINDRGPFARTERRIIDLSFGAAQRISLVGPGVAPVRVRALGPAGR